MDLTTDNRDLVWGLDSIKQRQRAVDFVMGFENKICVYSDSVEQLYTNYNIFFPKHERRQLVILPNPFAHHDIFNNIPAAAVTATGLNIIHGDVVGREGLYLLIPARDNKSRFRAVPLHTGLRVINKRRPLDKPLLPIIMKGDLRELRAETPCLHLHCLHLHRLQHLSPLERQGIQRVIVEHLDKLG
ncbi:hypothetical protein G8764_11770 [Pseudomaricurvus alcaniphilus]|uniref:hypothetical protein n=1 Tax=Pseudomaricurvus alcaniphilus TaxID=1166482 RepID=UPI00140DD401|nr:hypothetical protein [Pseudomaricurvus alcaniphilus]